MRYIGLNINSSKDKTGSILKEVRSCVERIFTDSIIYTFKDSETEGDSVLDKMQMMITLGGDGTIIRTARALCKHNIPILGVNIGNLGFLASVEKEELVRALLQIKENNYNVENRIMLRCEISNKEKSLVYASLNDIVLSKGALARMVKYQIKVDNNLYTEFNADGVIVSTPTGSTAYALSAGGPILYPTLSLIEVTPICPQSPGLRSLVLDSKSTVQVLIQDWNESIFLTVDGQESLKLDKGSVITISLSDWKCSLIRLKNYDYFNVLRDKIIWRTREINCEGD
ncbi:NAD(+)/NADH kinase [Clostridium thermarum]|uniref:NAD(+)/NADH kinase n=1 Tax=Clostridium thermarum TaxID=1716543 RepID=UPI0013D12B6F|nr:NAD(+)/NADH kinase [Clostridium thermarum]